MKTLEEILGDAEKYALSIMQKNGEFGLPCVIGYDETDGAFYHAIDMVEHEKDRLALMVALSLRKNGCDRYAFISEVWISEEAGKLGVQPKDAPDVKDGLQIAACDAVHAISRSYLVEGKEKAITLHREIDSREPGCSISGRWVTLLRRGRSP